MNSNPQIPETPDLLPASELPGEWIDNYLNEGAVPRGGEIMSYAVDYPLEASEKFRFVCSGVQQERIEQFWTTLKINVNVAGGGDVDGQTALPDQPVPEDRVEEREGEIDARGRSEAIPRAVDDLVLPDLDLPVDPTDESYEDTYYATLLREFPERILVTLEYFPPEQKLEASPVILYTIDPNIDAGIVHHYRQKFQSGATAGISATSGSVTLNMWRWFRVFGGSLMSEPLGSLSVVAGAALLQSPLQHNGFPNISTYDVSVTGLQNGSVYTVSGSWTVGF